MTDHAVLDELCRAAEEFYQRGDAFGGSGNLSCRTDDSIWITPTGSALRSLRPTDLARIDIDGSITGDNRPSKEYPFHLAIYRARPDARAIVHLHAPNAVAVSCLDDLDAAQPIPPLTPYFVMRVAPLGLVNYHRPGSDALADAVGRAAADFDCMLLRNHGHICTGASFADAAARAIELEETCRLYMTLRKERTRLLSDEEVRELREFFAPKKSESS